MLIGHNLLARFLSKVLHTMTRSSTGNLFEPLLNFAFPVDSLCLHNNIVIIQLIHRLIELMLFPMIFCWLKESRLDYWVNFKQFARNWIDLWFKIIISISFIHLDIFFLLLSWNKCKTLKSKKVDSQLFLHFLK